jgi:molybdopterin molybdotransferase
MVSVEEASRIIFSGLTSCGTEVVPIGHATGRILAEPIAADRPFPPFNRVAMDGIAIAFAAFDQGKRAFLIEDIQPAGQAQKALKHPDNCIEVMTGAILPSGTDTVIRYEDLSLTLKTAQISEVVIKGQNVHAKGIDARELDVLLRPGMRISAAEVALMASVGMSRVSVEAFPAAAVISTGDELVDIDETPLPYQIRKSNVFALQAAMHEMGWSAQVFHIRDDRSALTETLSDLVSRFDVLILSGGVSKGKFDFIPEVLEEIGIQKQFHQVSQRPGKPFWFGRSESGKIVFALPGNPVSTFMCFYRYIRPWVLKSMGYEIHQQYAVLTRDFTFQPKITCFLQVSVTNNNGILSALPVVGGGSGDFANLKDVNGFLELPANRTDFKKDEVFPFISFRS